MRIEFNSLDAARFKGSEIAELTLWKQIYEYLHFPKAPVYTLPFCISGEVNNIKTVKMRNELSLSIHTENRNNKNQTDGR